MLNLKQCQTHQSLSNSYFCDYSVLHGVVPSFAFLQFHWYRFIVDEEILSEEKELQTSCAILLKTKTIEQAEHSAPIFHTLILFVIDKVLWTVTSSPTKGLL